MPSVNVNVALTGFYGFLVAIYFIGAAAIVSFGTSGTIEAWDAWRGLGLLSVVILLVGIMVYIESIERY